MLSSETIVCIACELIRWIFVHFLQHFVDWARWIGRESVAVLFTDLNKYEKRRTDEHIGTMNSAGEMFKMNFQHVLLVIFAGNAPSSGKRCTSDSYDIMKKPIFWLEKTALHWDSCLLLVLVCCFQLEKTKISQRLKLIWFLLVPWIADCSGFFFLFSKQL